jgi:hypothetical protein
MKDILTGCLWQREQLSKALELLARAAGLRNGTASLAEFIGGRGK